MSNPESPESPEPEPGNPEPAEPLGLPAPAEAPVDAPGDRENCRVVESPVTRVGPAVPMPPPLQPRRLGCWFMPTVVALMFLIPGLLLARQWEEHGVLVHLATFLLVAVGGILALFVTLWLLFIFTMRRLGRQLKRDMQSLAYSARYMVNMKPNAPARPPRSNDRDGKDD